MESLFQGISVQSNRIIYTPSAFARANLLHLQEAGELKALKPHTSSRENLFSFLFFLVTDGAGSLLYDGQSHCLQAGDCVFIDCRKPYAQGSSEENLWSLKWAHFYGSSMNGIYEKYVERGGRPAFTPQEPALFASLLDCLLAIAGTEDYIRDMRINEKLTGLLTLLMAESWHPEAGSHIGGKKKSLQYVKTYLEEHYREKITLDRLAGQFYLNKFYLARTFKEQFGATVLGYLEQVRITRAKQLLRFSDLTAEAVGQEVGIGEPGYFCRVFKKVEGISPGEYRRMW
ncbi:MAG: helix-turn-helix transcriptional regulator [Lachnospiraceae bacterium]|jgi:AraC family transcriptional regulator of arabinose operon|nr:AraC family transcriptional regulator [uncultured Acetatifactor sp.]MCI9218531.1 helix-turn-helix transcriptional regulator [Lachnospiraceae bacterium]